MKSIFVLIAFMLIGLSGYSQGLGYSYDKAGNRTQCIIIDLTQPMGASPKSAELIKQDFGPRTVIIYPNPTKGNLLVEIANGDNDEDYKMLLYDVSGKLIMELNQRGNGAKPIDLSTYRSGMYILILKTSDGRMEYKIIKD